MIKSEALKTIYYQLDACKVITSQFGLQPDDCKEVHDRIIKITQLLEEMFKDEPNRR